MNRLVLLFLLAGLLGGGGGWLFNALVLDEPEVPVVKQPPTPESVLGLKRPDFTLGNVDGQRVSAADFNGEVLLLNFWATWCEPCRAEMPMLDQLHAELSDQGFQVVGIALDDVQQARAFVEKLGIEYPVLVGMADVMATGRVYGNRSGFLPYSVLIDRSEIIRWTHLGEISRSEVMEQVRPFL